MRTLLKNTLFLWLCVAGLHFANAQSDTMKTKRANSYTLSAGLRLGSPIAASLKYFPREKRAFEFFVGHRSYEETWLTYRYSWTMVGVTYAGYTPIQEVKNLQWFIGGGAGMFFWNWGKNTWLADEYASSTPLLILHGGLDYRFENTPLNVSLDWMPLYSISEYYSGFYAGYGALSARYILK
ncbi:MAG: hypothetical protein ACO1PI_02090 [Bacteroidota bacterium]